MRENLIELLCQAHNKSTEASAFDDATYAQQLEMEADHLIANGVTIQKWIPVSERLPEFGQRILVYCESKTIEKHITACTYMGGYLGAKEFSRHVRKVTHWMPLPEPPKEDQ